MNALFPAFEVIFTCIVAIILALAIYNAGYIFIVYLVGFCSPRRRNARKNSTSEH